MKSVKKKTSQFIFNNQYFTQEQVDFLNTLLKYCEKLEKKIENLSAYKSINNKLIESLSLLKNYYYFLKNNKDVIKINELDFSDETERKLENLYKKENFFEKFKYAFNKSKIDVLILQNERARKQLHKKLLKEYKKLYPIDLNIGEIYEESMKVKILINYLKKHRCSRMMVGNILFDIHFSLYENLFLSHFENIDENSWGILAQIDWLEKNLDLFKD
ncbi:hypothetical protein HYV57_01655 [Candidatus Peregrinibacteria bacterium]|nr:hypothetical protein [Candidatus Peregrinibacteria bacterium]